MPHIKLNRWRIWLFGFCTIVFLSGGVVIKGSTQNFQFAQLDSFFEELFFGVLFDYNQGISDEQALTLKTDLRSQTSFQNTSDLDPNNDNIIALIGHEALGFKTAFFALDKVKRTQNLPVIGAIEWETSVPFVKYLHQLSLPTGEELVSSHDFLGVALKINGSRFNPEYYNLGYANIPPDFISFLLEDSVEYSLSQGDQKGELGITSNSSFNPITTTKVMIESTENSFMVELTYSNLSFLFQTNNIDLNKISELEISDKFILAQFDHVTFSISVKKYSYNGLSGVETISEVSIGKVINLLINEELPIEPSWSSSEEYKISAKYKDLLPINETLSWYKGLDIKKRLGLFSEISFSLITAQNIGLLNGTNSIENLQTTIDNQNLSKNELNQFDYLINNDNTIVYDEKPLLVNIINERDFAIQKNEETDQFTLVPMKIKSIALNQQVGFSDNILFLQETSLLRDLVAECAKRFIDNSNVTSLSTDKFFKIGGLYLTAAQYIQDYQLIKWEGSQFSMNLLQYISKVATLPSQPKHPNQITEISIHPGLFALIVLISVLKIKIPKRK